MIHNSTNNLLPERESMLFDVVIVGAGPAGLSAAIRLKQLNAEISIAVVEKGAEVGSHIISGAIMDVSAISQLLPNWKDDSDSPFDTEVQEDHHIFLTKNKAFKVPSWLYPKWLKNNGCYILSLGNFCQWLAKKAEDLGVEIYAGFAAAEVLYDNDKVIGIATGDMGLDKEGNFTSSSSRGVALLAKYTLVAEGARGSLAKQIISKFNLDSNSQVAKFALGFKEIWQIDEKKHKLGQVNHYLGWPLDNRTAGGGFIYHTKLNELYVGFVVHLDYKNPYLSPFEEFQRFKTHPAVSNLLDGAKRVSYGARVINEGGWQSVPKVTFAGGALLGCSAGFVNSMRLKGSHNAILSGKLAAEAVAEALNQQREHDELTKYEQEWRESEIGKDIYPVRNFKPLLERFGLILTMPLALLDVICNKYLNFSPFKTLSHKASDARSLEEATNCKKIIYSKPDYKITFDRLSSIALSNVNYSPQPNHLLVKDWQKQKDIEYGIFDGPSTRYCPAGVYEWVQKGQELQYIINSENCIQCKSCDIKDPTNNITWTVPQGGDGPLYPRM